MRKMILFLFAGALAHISSFAQMLPPEALVDCAAHKDVKHMIETIKKFWPDNYGYDGWKPSMGFKAYNKATGNDELYDGYKCMESRSGSGYSGRILYIRDFKKKVVDFEVERLSEEDVDIMRRYVAANGFKKTYSYSTWIEKWESPDVIVDLHIRDGDADIRVSVYNKVPR